MIYMAHGYKRGILWQCKYDSVLCSYEGMQERIIKNCISITKKSNTELLPVGFFWKTLYEINPLLKLHGSDNVHPSRTGDCASACFIYSKLFKKNVTGLTTP